MAYSKNFPRTVDGSNYPRWEEVHLTEEEEEQEEEKCRKDNIEIMKECVDDAREVMREKGLKDYQSDLIGMAMALFRKRSSYSIHYKEQKAKDKFDEKYGCPVIINTSFNVRGEPIVCTPEDAYLCFMRTDMDYLLMANFLVDKKKQKPLDDKVDWIRQFELDLEVRPIQA